MKTQPLLLAASLALALPCHRSLAQDAPPAAPPPAPPGLHHPHHRHHHVSRLRTQAPAPLGEPAPPRADTAGTTPAPVPNEDIGPPRAPAGSSPSVDPGNLSIHYPPLGSGYLPGSSPQDMANTQTPKVPGVTVKLPLAQARPAQLPPPADH